MVTTIKAELLEFLLQEWHKVTQRQCERLLESMPRRMKAVIEKSGLFHQLLFSELFLS